MKQSRSVIETPVAGDYIGKLCRHFRHKIEAFYTADRGEAIFPAGRCDMQAQPNQLIFEIEATDHDGLEKIKGVLVRHLLKFAHRENLVIEWQDKDAPDAPPAT